MFYVFTNAAYYRASFCLSVYMKGLFNNNGIKDEGLNVLV